MQKIEPGDFVRTPTHNGDMERAVAIRGGGIYAAVVTTPPGGATRRHHHGACETAIYVLEGDAAFSWGPTGTEHELRATAGDFVHVPAGEVHVERNPSTDVDLRVIVARNCADAVTIYVDDEEKET